ncbi:GntR family transcriptional regulator [Acetobacter sp. TBRC 12305]|uniref:GntR family transcriptional regulator n=1 Tax=Acetobacter garciniae TaxID=2817435 RepID=A0A939HM95_9PROT|nr:GntR family transcriptional regulator [Acetobacter garciniae]MBO1325470.1 GntR family transcriptional regulator [Acetobacter garciniae]MBX0345358.1 GntR family transcriptional regulator [Acetobacter garciniae]
MPKSSGLSRPVRIAQLLRDDILNGALVSGQALVEAQMVERFGVSRNTIREAMHSLAQSGLVTVISNRGSFVRQLAPHEIRELYMIRHLIESGCCERVPAQQWTALEPVFSSAFTQARSAARNGDWLLAGTASLLFHRLLVNACGSDQLSQFFDTICAQMRLVFQTVADQEHLQSPWLAKDIAIFEALRAGQVKAATDLLHDYLTYSETLIFQIMTGQPT